MGYEKFSLITLQLPAPASNLTKAEYKEKYGIDLDDIDINKFTLVVYNGDKYAIDQIKEIEDGYEIYFNGRILSITDNVQTSGEVYAVENSKPIYCHPISIIGTGGTYEGTRLIILFFDNVSTPYNKSSLSSLISTFTGRLSVNGFMKDGTDFGPVAYIAGGNLVLQKNDGSVVSKSIYNIISDEGVVVDDNVNQIN